MFDEVRLCLVFASKKMLYTELIVTYDFFFVTMRGEVCKRTERKRKGIKWKSNENLQ